MDNLEWLKVRSNFVYLREKLVADDLAPHLYQDMAISEEDLEKIEAEPTPQKKSDRLLFIMKCKENGYQKLCKGLNLTQPFLVKLMENRTLDNTGEERIKSQLLWAFCECNGACVKVGEVREAIKDTIGPNIGDDSLLQKVKAVFPTANMDLQTFHIKNIKRRLPDQVLNLEDDAHGIENQRLQQMGVQDLCRTLKNRIKSENGMQLSLIDIFLKHGISGKVFVNMTPDELEKIQPDMTFGERKTLFLIRDEIINEENTQMNLTACKCGEATTRSAGNDTNSEEDDCVIVPLESPSINQNIVNERKETSKSQKRKRLANRSIDSSVPKTNNFKKSFSGPSQSPYPSIQQYFQKIRK